MGSKEEKDAEQASTQNCDRQRIGAKDQRQKKNGMLSEGGLFIEPKETGEEEALKQAINGHSLRANQRMPSVTDVRAASVFEPSGNNDD